MGDVLVNFTPLKMKTNCRFEKIKAAVKIIHYLVKGALLRYLEIYKKLGGDFA